MVTDTAAPTQTPAQGRAFLQHRVAVAGLFGACVGYGFLLYRTAATVVGDLREFSEPSYWLHFAGGFSMLTMWLVCRSGERPVVVVRTAETVGVLGAAASYSMMGLSIPAWQMPHFIVLLAVEGMLVARAIYVPSTARRTLLLTIAAGLPVLAATFAMYYRVDTTGWNHVDAEIRDSSPLLRSVMLTLFAGLWWTVTVALCTGASRVIYGLRKTVQDARKLGQYELTEKLGEGGMGVVYRAEHAMLRRPTAVKLLPAAKSGAHSVARFEKEVRQTARLTHPNTVTIFDYGRTPDGTFYYAMELLDGATAREVVELAGPQPAARVATVIEHAARALGEAHEVGLIHRDIKPANIMLVRQGGELDVAKVLDFGLVKELNRDVSTSLTHGDAITGTPQYLSPEAITRRDAVDGRSDLYALGAVAYYMLAGDHVFTGRSVVEVCSKHLHAEPQPVDDVAPSVPADFAALVMRCLAKAPDERPASAGELAAAIRACRVEPRWTQRDAEQWWADHREALEARRRDSAMSAVDMTMNIDFALRRTQQSR